MELSTSSCSRRTPIRTATTSARRTRRPALANSPSASSPQASSLVNRPMPSPPRQQVALLASQPHWDRTQTLSASPPVAPAVPPPSHKIPRQLSHQASASRRRSVEEGVHSVNRQRSAEEMPSASLRPLVVAVRSENPRVLGRPQELASASLQHWASQPIPSVLQVLANRRSPPNLRRLVASVSLRSWVRSQIHLPPAVLRLLPVPSVR